MEQTAANMPHADQMTPQSRPQLWVQPNSVLVPLYFVSLARCLGMDFSHDVHALTKSLILVDPECTFNIVNRA